MHWTAWEIRKSLYIFNTPICDDDNEDANEDDKKADEEKGDNDCDDHAMILLIMINNWDGRKDRDASSG